MIAYVRRQRRILLNEELTLDDVTVPMFTGLPARISNICVAVGDSVLLDSDIVEVETDMAVVPLLSTSRGTVSEICVELGQTVEWNTLLIRVLPNQSSIDDT